MAEHEENYVSVVSLALIQPLLVLVETLEASSVVTPNELQTGSRENGYSLAIIVIGVIILESALNRTAYVRGEKPGRPDYFARLSCDQDLAGRVEEVYAARNAISHNHVWEGKFTWDENAGMKFTEPPTLQKGYGDKRHWKVMDPATRKSRILKINMFPPRIWRRDAYIALKTIAEALKNLEAMDRGYFYLSPHHFRFQARTVTFNEAVESLSVPADI